MTVGMKRVSCGVIVTDGKRLLLGHATCSPRWDIPKGLAEPGEPHLAAALRELREETGLAASAEELVALGVHRYLPGKHLALFRWPVAALPDPRSLRCAATIPTGKGGFLPEFDRFGLFAWEDALTLVGRNLARVLGDLRD